MQLTDEQVTKMARKVCERRDIDPDEVMVGLIPVTEDGEQGDRHDVTALDLAKYEVKDWVDMYSAFTESVMQ